MRNIELIEKLKNLNSEIYNYAEYLKDYTYHPYSKVWDFADKLNLIIKNLENE